MIIIGTLTRLNAATNASAKQRLELLQTDRQPNNTMSSGSRKENAERRTGMTNANANRRHNEQFKNEKIK